MDDNGRTGRGPYVQGHEGLGSSMNTIDVGYEKAETVRALPLYRWAVRKGTNTDAPRLQQAWQSMTTGEVRWRNLDTVEVDDEEFYRQ